MARTSTTPRVKREIPQTVIDRIVKDIDSGMGVTAVAKALDSEKVTAPTPSGWYGRAVYNLYVKATGKKVGDTRKTNPLASRKLADRAPAATKKVTAPKKASTAKKGATAKATTKAAPKKAAAARSSAKATTSTARKSATTKANGNGKPQATPDPKPSAAAKK